MARPVLGGACLAAFAGMLATAPAAAQDIEARARPGVAVPSGYYELIRQKPDLFEVDRGWTARTALAAGPFVLGPGAPGRVMAGSAAGLTGTLPLVVIQALFADSPEPWMTSADISRVLFDGPSPYGTVTEYYHEVSRGQFGVTGTVTPWVRTAMTLGETVGESSGIGPTSRVGYWVVEAVREADAHIDFAQFDNDGPDGIPNSGDDDGYVDAIAVQFLEVAGSCGGPGIWPHRARIRGWIGEPYRSSDVGANGQPILVDSYIVQSAVDCEGTGLQTASVITHELGHIFGLPDLYHQADGLMPWQRRWVVGCWTLMAAGAWGCGDGSTWPTAVRPPHMGAWEKWMLGWIEPVYVGSVLDREYALPPVQTSGAALLVPFSSFEGLLIEYRPQIGYDVDLPASGVLIYHIDSSRPLYPKPGEPRLYQVKLLEADGDSALVRTAAEGGNRGVAGDAWAVDGPDSLSAITQPGLRRNNGSYTSVTIHSIEIVGGVARVRISNNQRPAIVAGLQPEIPTALEPWSHEIRVAGGVLPYALEVVGLPSGLTFHTVGSDRLQLHGTPVEHGAFTITVRITDARGMVVEQTLPLNVAVRQFSVERMLEPLIRNGAAPLTEEEKSYLDRVGNNNGRYDIGDVRRALRRQ